jgi:hypothetical protein
VLAVNDALCIRGPRIADKVIIIEAGRISDPIEMSFVLRLTKTNHFGTHSKEIPARNEQVGR